MAQFLIFFVLFYSLNDTHAAPKKGCAKQVKKYGFRLQPSTIPKAGCGVFAVQFIPKGTYLKNLFDPKEKILRLSEKKFAELKIPKILKKTFSIRYETKKGTTYYYIAADLSRLSIGWYLNESDEPNLAHDEDYNYFTIRDVKPGEELFIDYNQL